MIEILAPMLIRYGAPVLGGILRETVGGAAGEAGARVVEALGEAFGVRPEASDIIDAIEKDPDAAREKIRTVESERSAEWMAYLTIATTQRNDMLKREEERAYSRNWRPSLSWLLIVLWLWNGLLISICNAFGAGLAPMPWEQLLAFTGIWLTIYGGGHTMKSVMLGKA